MERENIRNYKKNRLFVCKFNKYLSKDLIITQRAYEKFRGTKGLAYPQGKRGESQVKEVYFLNQFSE